MSPLLLKKKRKKKEEKKATIMVRGGDLRIAFLLFLSGMPQLEIFILI